MTVFCGGVLGVFDKTRGSIFLTKKRCMPSVWKWGVQAYGDVGMGELSRQGCRII